MIYKDKSGLGVINIKIKGDLGYKSYSSMRSKYKGGLEGQLDKFYNKKNVQWVSLIWNKYYSDSAPHMRKYKCSFWWKDNFCLHTQYRGVAICKRSKGDIVSFWDDLLATLYFCKYPNMYHFAKDTTISLENIRNGDNLVDFFRIPMTQLAYNKMILLEADILALFCRSTMDDDMFSLGLLPPFYGF